MTHSLIVGFGIAGLTFAEQLIRNKKDFLIIDDNKLGASHISSGIYNPTILKRYSITWKGHEFLKYSKTFYRRLERRINNRVNYSNQINRIFSKESEFNQWISASEKIPLNKYLLSKFFFKSNKFISTKNGFGKVKNVGRIDVKKLIDTFKKKNKKNFFRVTKFHFERLKIGKDKILYDGVLFKNVIFCEGFKVVENPYFNYLPIKGSKGEMIIIKSPLLNENQIFKGSVFVVPIGNDNYWVGSNYINSFSNAKPSKKSKEWLVSNLNKIISCPYEIIDHKSNIRSTIYDRKQIIGQHKKFKNLFILNGLGSRGILTSPLLSLWLYESIENNFTIPNEVNVSRFD